MGKPKSINEWRQDVIDQIELLSERDDQKQGEINLLRTELDDLRRAVAGDTRTRPTGDEDVGGDDESTEVL